MALLTKQDVVRAGLAPTYAAVGAAGDEFVPTDNTFLHVKNGNAAATNVTVVTPKTVGGQAIADLVVSVPAAGERFIGPFPPSQYANPAAGDGKADVTYSVTATVTVACLELATG